VVVIVITISAFTYVIPLDVLIPVPDDVDVARLISVSSWRAVMTRGDGRLRRA